MKGSGNTTLLNQACLIVDETNKAQMDFQPNKPELPNEINLQQDCDDDLEGLRLPSTSLGKQMERWNDASNIASQEKREEGYKLFP